MRILDKLSKHPTYAKAPGIKGVQGAVGSDDLDMSDASGSSRSR